MNNAWDWIEIEEAWDRIRSQTTPLGSERVSLEEAGGRVLGEAVLAQKDFPYWTHAAMDGYAVRGADGAGTPPFRFQVVGTVYAGDAPEEPLRAGEAVRIMTGAMLPPGADTVVPQEEVKKEGPGEIVVPDALRVGAHVRAAGEDFRARSVVLHAGQYLTPAAIALAAGAGWSELEVFLQPRIVVLATGDELVPPGHPLDSGRIWETNSYYLTARCRALGLPVTRVTTAGDTLEAVVEKFERALSSADALITTGGVSVGERDLVREAWVRIGGEILFHGVRMKPGKPILVGRREGRWLFGMPGNPASTFTGFELFIYPWLWWCQGLDRPLPYRFQVRLRHPVENRSTRRWFVRAVLEWDEEEWWGVPLSMQGSHILSSTVKAQALLEIPAGRKCEADATVTAFPLGWHPFDLGAA